MEIKLKPAIIFKIKLKGLINMKKGFTLIEIMIVIAIIGILASMAIPNFRKARDHANEVKCWEGTSLLTRCCEQYNCEYHSYPSKLDDLKQYIRGDKLPICPKGGIIRFLEGYGTEIVECSEHGCASATWGG